MLFRSAPYHCSSSVFSASFDGPTYDFPAPTGITWMNRTGTFSCSANSISSCACSSFRCTAFSFTKRPASLAAQIPCFTCSSASRPVSAANSAASTVSRLTFTLSQPAAFRSLAHDARRTPFVVIPTDAVPGTAFIFCTSSTHSFLTSGSPPVIR